VVTDAAGDDALQTGSVTGAPESSSLAGGQLVT